MWNQVGYAHLRITPIYILSQTLTIDESMGISIMAFSLTEKGADLATDLVKYLILLSSRGAGFKPKKQNLVRIADMWLQRDE